MISFFSRELGVFRTLKDDEVKFGLTHQARVGIFRPFEPTSTLRILMQGGRHSHKMMSEGGRQTTECQEARL